MIVDKCLFCQIARGRAERELVWEDDSFVAIKNKYPKAPVHILVMPKEHWEKSEMASSNNGDRWGKIMSAVLHVVCLTGLSKTGYKLVNNGAGYNHFEHEHVHIMGGSTDEPGGQT
jgi:histidine triad (HIT) family protein